MSHWKEALVQTQDTHWRDYIAWQAWKHLNVPVDKLEEVAKEWEKQEHPRSYYVFHLHVDQNLVCGCNKSPL